MSVPLYERINNYKRYLVILNYLFRINLFKQINTATNRFEDVSKHIIISGEPRGGTTWMMELMLENDMNYVWEPLFFKLLKDYEQTPGFDKQLGFMPYIPEYAEWPEAKEYFSRLFSGKEIHSQTILGYPDHFFKLGASQLLFKFCRANMLLPWLVKKFNIKPVFLLRHPLSVYSSQLKHKAFDGMGKKYNLFQLQQSKYDDVFKKYEYQISSIDSPESMFANWWAINNIVPLSSESNNRKWVTVAYEKLLLEPEKELLRIYSRLNRPMPADINTRLKKPSATTVGGSNILSGGNQLLSWKKYVDDYTADKILDIVNSYGITAYTKAPEPNYGALNAIG